MEFIRLHKMNGSVETYCSLTILFFWAVYMFFPKLVTLTVMI